MTRDPRIRIATHRKLSNPTLVAAWPGVGLVGFNAVEFLRSTLNPDQVAEIDTPGFFAIQGVQAKDGSIVPLRYPTSTFYAWKSPKGKSDLLLFLGTAQPVSGREVELARLVLDAGMRLGAKRVFTAAAMVAQIDHVAPSRVWAVTALPDEWEALELLGVHKLQDGLIGGLNGLLIGVAQERGLPAACLMGEMPHYTTNIENPKASVAVLEVLLSVLGITVDLSSLRERARYIELQIQAYLQTARDGSPGPEGGSTENSDTEDVATSEGSDRNRNEPGKGGGTSIN